MTAVCPHAVLGRCQIETVLLCTGHLSDCVVTRLHHITSTECQVLAGPGWGDWGGDNNLFYCIYVDAFTWLSLDIC